MPLPDFDAAYRGEPDGIDTQTLPWDIGEPQPAIAALVDAGELTGPVLDAGCGTATTVLALAALGYEVVGLDASTAAIARGRERAAERGLDPELAVADVRDFGGHDGRFAAVVDSTLFHSLPVEGRDGYLRSVARAARPGARLFVLVLTREAPFPPEIGLNLVTGPELHDAVSAHWVVDSITHAPIHVASPPGVGAGLARDAAGRHLYPGFLLRAHRPG